jgi:hypothetical protein
MASPLIRLRAEMNAVLRILAGAAKLRLNQYLAKHALRALGEQVVGPHLLKNGFSRAIERPAEID